MIRIFFGVVTIFLGILFLAFLGGFLWGILKIGGEKEVGREGPGGTVHRIDEAPRRRSSP